jgi:hypothetical protein
MTDDRKKDELTEDELEQTEGEELPDREVMSLITGPEPIDGDIALPIVRPEEI